MWASLKSVSIEYIIQWLWIILYVSFEYLVIFGWNVDIVDNMLYQFWISFCIRRELVVLFHFVGN